MTLRLFVVHLSLHHGARHDQSWLHETRLSLCPRSHLQRQKSQFQRWIVCHEFQAFARRSSCSTSSFYGFGPYSHHHRFILLICAKMLGGAVFHAVCYSADQGMVNLRCKLTFFAWPIEPTSCPFPWLIDRRPSQRLCKRHSLCRFTLSESLLCRVLSLWIVPVWTFWRLDNSPSVTILRRHWSWFGPEWEMSFDHFEFRQLGFLPFQPLVAIRTYNQIGRHRSSDIHPTGVDLGGVSCPLLLLVFQPTLYDYRTHGFSTRFSLFFLRGIPSLWSLRSHSPIWIMHNQSTSVPLGFLWLYLAT